MASIVFCCCCCCWPTLVGISTRHIFDCASNLVENNLHEWFSLRSDETLYRYTHTYTSMRRSRKKYAEPSTVQSAPVHTIAGCTIHKMIIIKDTRRVKIECIYCNTSTTRQRNNNKPANKYKLRDFLSVSFRAINFY